ncbi:TetR/AcrR family transcriptional regulator [Clostridioides difficile]|nr:TetR/AcrR family transcriptional regulator [Clostridioides difficile]
MPPKIKTDRDAIINAGFEVAKNEGITVITAQKVALVLGTSVAPIFREFQTVEDLRIAVEEKIHTFHAQYISEYPLDDSAFLTYGLGYINFAKEYPNLFEAIMQQNAINYNLNEQASKQLAFVVDSAASEGSLSFEQAKELFYNIWIYTHGIACLVYKGSLTLTVEEEKQLLITAFNAFITKYKK